MSGPAGGGAQRGLRPPPHPAWSLLRAPPSECGLFRAEQQLWDSGCRTLAGEPTPQDCSPPGSSIHGIFQARVLEWGAIAFSTEATREQQNNRIAFPDYPLQTYYSEQVKTIKSGSLAFISIMTILFDSSSSK